MLRDGLLFRLFLLFLVYYSLLFLILSIFYFKLQNDRGRRSVSIPQHVCWPHFLFWCSLRLAFNIIFSNQSNSWISTNCYNDIEKTFWMKYLCLSLHTMQAHFNMNAKNVRASSSWLVCSERQKGRICSNQLCGNTQSQRRLDKAFKSWGGSWVKKKSPTLQSEVMSIH